MQKNRNKLESEKPVEYPLIFDSILFNSTERNYGTYKRELFTIINFLRKYYYMFMYGDTSTVFIDYKPLTFFLYAH